MYQYQFINYNVCTTLMQDVNRGYRGPGNSRICENLQFAGFFRESNTAIKHTTYLNKHTISFNT